MFFESCDAFDCCSAYSVDLFAAAVVVVVAVVVATVAAAIVVVAFAIAAAKLVEVVGDYELLVSDLNFGYAL